MVLREEVFHLSRFKRRVCRPYGLMGLLSAFTAFIDIWPGGKIFRAKGLFYRLSDGCHSLGAKTRRVSTHIGNETDRPLLTQVYSFIELLGQAHGLLGR